MQVRLSAALVRRLLAGDPPAKTTDYFDISLGRFFLRCRPAARPDQPFSASFYIRYTADGIERRIKVGDARAVALDEAQAAAKKLLARADLGHDPAHERRTSRADWTVREAISAYLASGDFAGKAESTKRVDRNLFANHLLTRLGGTKLTAIDLPAIRRLMRAIETDERIGARGRQLGGAGIARHAVRLLSVVINFAVSEGRLARNPLRDGGLRLGGGGTRETIISTAAEYGRLFETMDRLVADGRIRELTRAFLILAAATGCRKSELQRLQWRDVDLTAGRLTLRHTKGSRLARSGSKSEAAGLPPVAAEALMRIRPADVDPTTLVFPPASGRVMSIDREWQLVRREAGLPADLVLHSLRHSVGSLAAAAGMSAFEIQRLLRHRDVGTTGRYVHWAETQHARLIGRAMDGVLPMPSVPTAEPTPLPRPAFKTRGRR